MPDASSGRPLFQKLGLKPGMEVAVLNAPANYRELLGGLPAEVSLRWTLGSGLHLIHLFVTRRAELTERLDELRGCIRPEGMIWISWPKRSSGHPTDLTEEVIREIALAHHLVDVKVCAVSEVWSGLKLVIRLRDRGASHTTRGVTEGTQ